LNLHKHLSETFKSRISKCEDLNVDPP